jgi:hypothetical protein
MNDCLESDVWEISNIADSKKNSGIGSLEAFFTAKLGFSAGKNLYKELLRVLDASDNTAIDLAKPKGPFVHYRSQ